MMIVAAPIVPSPLVTNSTPFCHVPSFISVSTHISSAFRTFSSPTAYTPFTLPSPPRPSFPFSCRLTPSLFLKAKLAVHGCTTSPLYQLNSPALSISLSIHLLFLDTTFLFIFNVFCRVSSSSRQFSFSSPPFTLLSNLSTHSSHFHHYLPNSTPARLYQHTTDSLSLG